MGIFDDLIPQQAAPIAPNGGNMFADLIPSAPVNDQRFDESGETGAAGLRGIPILGALVNKAGAAVSAAANPVTGVGASGDTFADRYAKDLAQENVAEQAYESAHPAESTAAGLVGGTAALGPLAETSLGAKLLGLTGATLPRMIAIGATAGAALNAADTALRGGNPMQGAAIGAVTGALGPVAGHAIGGSVRAARNFLSGPSAVATEPENVMRVAGVDVPLSTGQMTGDVATQMMENNALRGGEGQAPQRVAEGFFRGQQAPAIEQARSAIGRTFDPLGMQIAQDPLEAAELASSGVQNAASTAKQGYRSLYNEALSFPGEFNAATFEGVGQKIKGALSLSQNPVIIDDVTTPVASKAIQHIDNTIGQLRIQNRADPFGQPNPENIGGVNLQGVDQARKQLINMASATERGTADNRAMTRIIGAFDDQVQNGIENGLFSGDDRALDAIKEARQAYANYRQVFTKQGAGDDVGAAMEKIIGRNGNDGATPTEVANYLYGNAKVGSSGLSVRLAQRMKGILGGDSPEWSAIRQGLWSRLSEATEGTTEFGSQKVANRINEFLNGAGKPLSQLMFDSNERALMSRYALLQQHLTPKPGTVNYSNTAPVLRMIASNTLRALGASLGGITAGPAGAAAALAADLAGVGPNAAARAMAERSASGRIARSLYRSPASNAADQAFANQMARYGAFGTRALTGPLDQQAIH